MIGKILPHILLILIAISADAAGVAQTVHVPPPDARNQFYVSDRQPLRPSAFVKLPIGSITPRGWLRNELLLEADGMTGHLEEISHWCSVKNSGWADPTSPQKQGWEELPYWLKGYGDLGYVLNNDKIIDETKRWIDVILKGQDETGWFGPRDLLHSRDCDGHVDLWPNMLVLNIMQSWYEYSHDNRVIPFMTRYFKWELNYPEQDFLHGYWPKIRGGDNLESVYWLYNRTDEAWLLDLAKKIHDHTYNWTSGPPNLHNVNFAQSFREPAEYWQQAKNPKFLDATQRQYDTVMGTWGQVPGGGFGADENARKGYVDPRQGFETCGIVEFMHSFEMLERMTGNPRWIDRCEDLAFNSLPAALTPDEKGLHYLTCPNQVILDRTNKAPGINNRGTMFSYSPGAVYRCCQHNVAMGWPYFAEELWLATPDNGLCASIYSASDVTAKVGDGQEVTISEDTQYPFSETISFVLTMSRPVEFPLYLRVPRWCDALEVRVNDEPAKLDAKPDTFIVIGRQWKSGDRVTLRLPMKIALRVWHRNHNSVSVDRGPLTFALAIGEKWEKYGSATGWPEYEVFPTTPWNYGLIVDEQNPADSFKVEQKETDLAQQPFTPDSVPIRLTASAKQIPQWKTDKNRLLEPLQQSPVKSDQPAQTITLIPMGAARLRISAFPVIGDGLDAHVWVTN
ncbi:MAG TPA: beta-L-arabinofuranosidase domain-containing protein [Tepidisphaeraceae bacterium]|nr:beta-L-arabinofuranosidase domain-containing protein [Tepidisphaeraceae bacterium]